MHSIVSLMDDKIIIFNDKYYYKRIDNIYTEQLFLRIRVVLQKKMENMEPRSKKIALQH